MTATGKENLVYKGVWFEIVDRNGSLSTSLKVWGSYYQHLETYLPGTSDEANLDSRVVSFSVEGVKKGQKLKEPITFTLHHNMRPVKKHKRICVFWDFDSDGGGNWSDSGCTIKTSNSEYTVCICDHLTNFAILMSPDTSDDVVLSIISTIGCIISVIALILTVIIYAATWKQSKSDQATVLLNLCVALIIANVIFLAGADKVHSKVGCKVVAVLLHYFFLAAFFLMLAEGLELLLYVIIVFRQSKTVTTKLIVAAWILPLIIVAISLGVTKTIGYGTENSCWLGVENGLLWAFIGPIVCIILVNLVIIVIALRKIAGKMHSKQKEKKAEIRSALWNLSVLCPIMGVAWIFGILCVSFNSVVFQYIFAIANSLQGLLIFLFHALLRNQKINNYLPPAICCRNISLSGKSESTQETVAKETSSQHSRNDNKGNVPSLTQAESKFIKYEMPVFQNIDKNLSTICGQNPSLSTKSESTQETVINETSEQSGKDMKGIVATLVNFYQEIEEKNISDTRLIQDCGSTTSGALINQAENLKSKKELLNN